MLPNVEANRVPTVWRCVLAVQVHWCIATFQKTGLGCPFFKAISHLVLSDWLFYSANAVLHRRVTTFASIRSCYRRQVRSKDSLQRLVKNVKPAENYSQQLIRCPHRAIVR